MKHKLFPPSGFTIVELLVVVVVIGILTSIVVLSGNAYIKKSAETTVQSNLQAAATKFRNEKAKTGAYPTTQSALNSLVKSNSDTALTLMAANSTQFCLKGTSWKYSDIFYYVSNSSAKPSTTDCTSQVAIDTGGGGGGGSGGGSGGGGGGGTQHAIVSNPASYDFGTISSGSVQHTFTLTNTSSSPVTIYTVNGSGPQGLWWSFWSISCPGQYSNFSITLQPGQSCNYGVSFFNYQNSTNPPSTVPGPKSGYLILYEQAPGGGTGTSYHILEMTGNIAS